MGRHREGVRAEGTRHGERPGTSQEADREKGPETGGRIFMEKEDVQSGIPFRAYKKMYTHCPRAPRLLPLAHQSGSHRGSGFLDSKLAFEP